jgi:hypothetical protein
VPGDPFWTPLMATMEPLLLAHGLISPSDISLYKITDNIHEAVSEVVGFYRNYHSIRFVDNRLYIRVQRPLPSPDVLALSQQFSHIGDGEAFLQGGPTPEEVRDNDNENLTRISFNYTAKGFADLRPLIDALNEY